MPISIQSSARLRPIRGAPNVMRIVENVPLTSPVRSAARHLARRGVSIPQARRRTSRMTASISSGVLRMLGARRAYVVA